MTMTISVVIPAYNAGGYIARAIDSVLAQSRKADQIIVVDDGSTDNTAEVARGYGDKILLIQQDNSGASAARNAGIKAATSEWIAFLDGDDEYLGDCLSLHCGLLERNRHLSWSTGNFIRCDCGEDHQQYEDMTAERLAAVQRILDGKEYFESYFTAHTAFAAGCCDTIMIKREVLIEAGLFEEGLMRINDVDMWLRVAYRYPQIGFTAKPLAVYHLDIPDSIVKANKDPKIIMDFIDRHIALSAEHGFGEEFKPSAAKHLSWWINMLLEQKNGRAVREILGKYGYLFSGYCRTTTYIRAMFPRISQVYETLKRKIKGGG